MLKGWGKLGKSIDVFIFLDDWIRLCFYEYYLEWTGSEGEMCFGSS